MELGNFCLSLSVKDLAVSRDFYERLGFAVRAGDAAQGWLVLKGPSLVIGLFQGMFDGNILTFNPGWDGDAQNLASFTDIRDIQRQMKAAGLTLTTEADETTSGPAHLILSDPDGNVIMVDQHR